MPTLNDHSENVAHVVRMALLDRARSLAELLTYAIRLKDKGLQLETEQSILNLFHAANELGISAMLFSDNNAVTAHIRVLQPYFEQVYVKGRV